MLNRFFSSDKGGESGGRQFPLFRSITPASAAEPLEPAAPAGELSEWVEFLLPRQPDTAYECTFCGDPAESITAPCPQNGGRRHIMVTARRKAGAS